jgi:hypothetical protein
VSAGIACAVIEKLTMPKPTTAPQAQLPTVTEAVAR